jgi:hypothetical protein
VTIRVTYELECARTGCQLTGPPAATRAGAWTRGKAAGWSLRAGVAEHYCPTHSRRVERDVDLLLPPYGLATNHLGDPDA